MNDRPTQRGPAVMSPPEAMAHDAAAARTEVARSAGSSQRFAHAPGLLLIAVLTVQAVLSLRLVWSNTASLNEAIYLFGGHVELAHWLHGTPLPPLATYLPGAPVIYPPLTALAASAGGLAAARLLSLAFVLGATGLLWSTTSKLFGRPAGFFAAALFAVAGPTQALGALATYDAMALCLLAASAWCVVSAQDRDNSTWLLVAGTSLLALANAAEYATVVLDPAVIALAAITVATGRGLKPGFVRSGHLAASTLGLVGALLALGGPWYLSGVLATTFSGAGGQPVSLVLADASKWCGLVCALAALGVICALRRADRGHLVTVIVLAVSGTLVPLDQALLHNTASLFKEADLGAWFAGRLRDYPDLRGRAADVAARGSRLAGRAPGRGRGRNDRPRPGEQVLPGLAELRGDDRGAAFPDPRIPGELPRRGLRRAGLLPGRHDRLAAVVADVVLHLRRPAHPPAAVRRRGVPGGHR
jgi:hypothetical protein